MLDQRWLKSLIEAARDRLWNRTAAEADARSLCADVGLLSPRSELERLLLLGLVADVRAKAFDQGERSPDLDAVVTCIRANYQTAGFSRLMAARATGLSESWIAHHCRQGLGASFTEVVAAHRLNHAAEMLASTNVTVKEVAFTVGYTNTASFTRAFTRRLGLPPSDWRTKRQALGSVTNGPDRRRRPWHRIQRLNAAFYCGAFTTPQVNAICRSLLCPT